MSKKYVLVGISASKDFPATSDALYKSINRGMDLVIFLLDKTLKNIEYATYGGGSNQRIMDPIVSYLKESKLIISSMCISPDFPVTLKFADPDNTWTNCLWEFDLNKKN